MLKTAMSLSKSALHPEGQSGWILVSDWTIVYVNGLVIRHWHDLRSVPVVLGLPDLRIGIKSKREEGYPKHQDRLMKRTCGAKLSISKVVFLFQTLFHSSFDDSGFKEFQHQGDLPLHVAGHQYKLSLDRSMDHGSGEKNESRILGAKDITDHRDTNE